MFSTIWCNFMVLYEKDTKKGIFFKSAFFGVRNSAFFALNRVTGNSSNKTMYEGVEGDEGSMHIFEFFFRTYKNAKIQPYLYLFTKLPCASFFSVFAAWKNPVTREKMPWPKTGRGRKPDVAENRSESPMPSIPNKNLFVHSSLSPHLLFILYSHFFI